MPKAIIELKNVSKQYRLAESPAIKNVSLAVYEKERLGLIGANGSGKTTLMRLMLNFVRPDTGELRILGSGNIENVRRYIGFVAERQEGMENFTPRELLEISARMYGLNKIETNQRIESLLTFAEISDVADQLLADFSKGMAQRVQICLALLHQPKILLLDEPMSGLDPGGQKDVRKMLEKLEDITLVFASHHLDEIELFCTSVVFLHHGEIVAQRKLAENRNIIFTLEITPAAKQILMNYFEPTLQIVGEKPDYLKVQFETDSDIFQKFVAELTQCKFEIKRLRSSSILETLYHQYVHRRTN